MTGLIEIESLLQTSNSLGTFDDKTRENWYVFLLEMSDAESIEFARMAVCNVAFRHAGFRDSHFDGSSQEGMEHSLKRVLDLMKESLDNGD